MRHSLRTSPPMWSPPLNIVRSEPQFMQEKLWLVLGGGIATVTVGVILYVCMKKLFLGKLKLHWSPDNSQGVKINLRRFVLEELEKATKNFSQEFLVGSGAFGNVYKGAFDEGTLAIKKARADSYHSIEEFRNEVELLSRVKHKNLAGLVGFCEEAGQRILVYEYVPNGSLLEYIAGRREKTLTWRQRVNIAIGAAEGISYLHEGIKPSIIHRDIKPSNILIGDGFEAKVSDFGLVKSGPVGDASHVSSQIKGTPGYLDPAYCSSLHLTPFCDVYSFGVILLQLITARPALDATRNSQYHIIDWAKPSIEQGNVGAILDANLLTNECNMEMMLKMGQLGLRCIVKVPRQRPTMSQVYQELGDALLSTEMLIFKQPSKGLPSSSVENEDSYSYMSVDGVGLQRFHVEMESLDFRSTSLRCLEANIQSMDFDTGGIHEKLDADDENGIMPTDLKEKYSNDLASSTACHGASMASKLSERVVPP